MSLAGFKAKKRRSPKHRLEKHQHDWEYGPGSGGWGIARCKTCPKTDIY